MGTLCVVLRAEADAAENTAVARTREDHIRRAHEVMQRIRAHLERSPPRVLAGFRLETPETSLVLAEAELSRVTAPAPDRWKAAIRDASYAYWRTLRPLAAQVSLLQPVSRRRDARSWHLPTSRPRRWARPCLRIA